MSNLKVSLNDINLLFSRLTIPHSWVRFTQENIARSQKEREISERLRGDIDALLRMCANQMWAQFNSVNNAFNERLQNAQDTKNKLQNHLERVGFAYFVGVLNA